jgi:predicted metal-dependent HD superfamily phosphohydrolase
MLESNNKNRVYLERWKNLFKRINCNKSPEEQFHSLIKAYSENHRAYHNFNHIEQCLMEFDQVRKYLDLPDLVEIAIWYHDVIYNTRSDRNEEESALLAERELNNLGIKKKSIKTVHNLILSTKHNDEPKNSDTKYLIDIDLSILGAASNIFKEYENNIRKEYKWVPKFIYQKERFEVLKSFLRRKHIFYTGLFREKYEHQARTNINSVLSV